MCHKINDSSRIVATLLGEKKVKKIFTNVIIHKQIELQLPVFFGEMCVKKPTVVFLYYIYFVQCRHANLMLLFKPHVYL